MCTLPGLAGDLRFLERWNPKDLSACTTVVKRLNSIMCSVPGEPSVCSAELVRAFLLNEISWPEVVAL